ncbi:hypothetical protein MRX96_024855 [Rhipicephalus microplus]
MLPITQVLYRAPPSIEPLFLLMLAIVTDVSSSRKVTAPTSSGISLVTSTCTQRASYVQCRVLCVAVSGLSKASTTLFSRRYCGKDAACWTITLYSASERLTRLPALGVPETEMNKTGVSLINQLQLV